MGFFYDQFNQIYGTRSSHHIFALLFKSIGEVRSGRKFMFLFSKDVLNGSKVTVKTFIMS